MSKIKLDVISNGMNGEGIARHNGKVVFIDGLIEGEIATAEIIKENKNFIKAKPITIEKTSEYRCQPKCPYFDECGGCDLQHINYVKQLQIKSQNVQNLFDKISLNYIIEKCEPSINIFGYRNKLTMYLNENNNLCFYKKNSKQLI